MKQHPHFFTVKTSVLQPPKSDLFPVLDQYITDIQDGDLLFITTKVLSIHQGNCIPVDGADKDDLAKQAASHFILRDYTTPYPSLLTITNGCLMPSAGIDRSNANNHFILWPADLDNLLMEIRAFLINKFGVKNLGIIATDTRSNPLQIGTSGLAVACCGFQPIYSYTSSTDLFNKPFEITRVNIAQSLASMAVFIMGEGREQTPIAIYRNCASNPSEASKIKYTNEATTSQIICPLEQDMFLPLLRPFLSENKQAETGAKTATQKGSKSNEENKDQKSGQRGQLWQQPKV